MIKKIALALAVCALAALPVLTQPAPDTHFDGKTWWGYVKVLADDKMEGRETGSAPGPE